MGRPSSDLLALGPYEIDPIDAWKPVLGRMSRFIETKLQDKHFEPEDLDKLLPKNPKIIQELLFDETYSLEVRRKVLEVALLRGGSVPSDVLRSHARGTYDPAEWAIHGVWGVSPRKTAEFLEYQAMAVAAAIGDRGALFAELSRSGDWIHDRQPATQLMHIALQEGGMIKDRNDVEDWMLELHPEYRGRAMFHLNDAAASKDIAGGAKLDTVYVELGGGPLTAGASYRYENTHWQRVARDIEGKVTTVLNESPDQGAIDAYNKGLIEASRGRVGKVAR